jgi:ferredoxin-NADP reductase
MANDRYLEWQTVSKTKETRSAFTYKFEPVSNSQKFDTSIGQFVMLGSDLKRPSKSGQQVRDFVQRAYSIASSPLRENIEITIKDEKPYGYINPSSGMADGFAAYFLEQIEIGDVVKIRPDTRKDHFMSKIAEGKEKDIAYWSGSNGAESARSLIQYLEDIKDTEYNLILFYSNPNLYMNVEINVIYYKWLLEMADKLNNFKVVFTFTRDEEVINSNHPRIFYRKGRFFSNIDGTAEKTLSKYHGNTEQCFNPICGSSAFINGTVKLPDGKIERRQGIMQQLINIENIKPDKIDKEQFYLQFAGE